MGKAAIKMAKNEIMHEQELLARELHIPVLVGIKAHCLDELIP